ncbi:MAG: Fe-S-cluster containining protein [Myxococcota bacterium]|jgi:Fe-S-cluster containining protein
MSKHDPATLRMGFAEARDTPCTGCSASCCTFLPLHDFQITRYEELDYAFYLLNFDRIELALLSGNSWRVHYRAPCSNLDLATRRCTVHGTDKQPHVCKRYNPYNCFYKRMFESPETIEYVRMDRERMKQYASMLVFNGHRDIISYPDVSFLKAAFDKPLAFSEATDPKVPASKALQAWESSVRTGMPLMPLPVKAFSDFHNPCSDCSAWCCTRVSFPHSTPANVGNLDHIRFCLGFPGVEIGVNEHGAWTIVIRTRCQHRVVDEAGRGRCGIFGQPERPAACEMYDASLCGYRSQFGHPRPARYLRLTREGFEIAAKMFSLDDNGYALNQPGYVEIRDAIEGQWREGA